MQHLTSVDGEIVFDADPDAVGSIGAGVRLADGLTIEDGEVLARAWTELFAAFEIRRSGAAVSVRPRLLTSRPDTIAAIADELQPRLGDEAMVPYPDVGVDYTDLAGAWPRPRLDQRVGTSTLGELATGRGVGAAIAAWLGDLGGVTVAVEGFGVVATGVARDLVDRGARVVAVSTERGAIADSAGFDIDSLVAARDEHGAEFVHRVDREVHLPRELHELPVDVLVPAGAPRFYDTEKAQRVQARLIAPAALAPYGEDAADVFRSNRVTALPAALTAAGVALADDAPIGLSAPEVLGRVDRLITERVEAAKASKMDPILYAATLADTFASTWLPTS